MQRKFCASRGAILGGDDEAGSLSEQALLALGAAHADDAERAGAQAAFHSEQVVRVAL